MERLKTMDSVSATLPTRLLVILVSLGVATAQTKYVNETCTRGAAPCASLVGHIASGNQSLTDIGKLYGVSVGSLLGSNNVDLNESSAATKLVPAKKLVQVPLQCSCVNGTRTVNETSYTIVSDDTLSSIAEQKFSGLVTYQEIAAANGIENADAIQPGQRFVIPFPCACENNTFQGNSAVYLTYAIQSGDDLGAVAATYGTTAAVIGEENGIQNLTNILAGDRIDIPLTACFSRFDAKAVDYSLLVPKGTYSLSPGAGCVQSFCYGSPIAELHSYAAPKWNATSTCPSLTCSNGLPLGNFTTSRTGDVCTVTECAYEGYANASAIFKTLQVSNRTICPVVTAPPPGQPIESVPSPPPVSSPPSSPSSPPPPPPPGGQSSAVKLWGASGESPTRNVALSIALSICVLSMKFHVLEWI